MDWSSFWGSGNMPAMGNDPYEPTAEQRRRILEQSLRGLGQGMVKAAFAPSWGGFGMAFNEGLASMSDIQQSGYDRMMEQNQKNALFKSNMEQEGLATEQAKLGIQHSKNQLRDDDEDHQIKEAIRAEAPAMINSLAETTKAMLDSAQVPDSLKPKLDLARKQLETQKALALRDPEHYLEKFNSFAFSVADMVGKKDALQEAMDEKANDHAIGTGWVNQGEDGSITPDIPGMIAWTEKRRNQELRQGEASIRSTNALAEHRENPTPGTDPSEKGLATFTPRQLEIETDNMNESLSYLGKFRVDDDHLDIGGKPKATQAARDMGLDISKIDPATGLLALSPDDKLRLEKLGDRTFLEQEAFNKLQRQTDRINRARGKKVPGSSTAASDAETPVADEDAAKPVKYPKPEKVKEKIEKYGVAKVIAELKALGLKADEIKKLYGI